MDAGSKHNQEDAFKPKRALAGARRGSLNRFEIRCIRPDWGRRSSIADQFPAQAAPEAGTKPRPSLRLHLIESYAGVPGNPDFGLLGWKTVA